MPKRASVRSPRARASAAANGTRFGPETRAAILARLELGATFADAATAGVKVPTAKTWLARGRREPSGTYRDFADAVARARAGVDSTEPGDIDELRRRVWRMVEAGSVEAAKLYLRILLEEEVPVDPWKALGIERRH